MFARDDLPAQPYHLAMPQGLGLPAMRQVTHPLWGKVSLGGFDAMLPLAQLASTVVTSSALRRARFGPWLA
jgi:hypothetical protein